MVDSEDEPQEGKSRQDVRVHTWKCRLVNMYILPKKKYKGVKELISVGSFDSCQAIVDAAIARDDQRLLLNIKGVDLIAEEAKYHEKCRSKYVSNTNLKCLSYKEDNKEIIFCGVCYVSEWNYSWVI